jgi:hypothetical protein
MNDIVYIFHFHLLVIFHNSILIYYLLYFIHKMEDTQYTDDDLFYASDFEDDLNDLVEVENFLRSVDENKDEFRETVGFQEAYFKSNWELDDDEEEDDETNAKHELPTVMGDELDDITSPNLTYESSSLFENISIQTFPKYVHFTINSLQLMINCLQNGGSPTYNQIHEADFSFVPLPTIYGRSTKSKEEYHTIERWKALQKKLKVVEGIEGFGLSPLNDSKGRKIPPKELWRTIVLNGHIDNNRKHLSQTLTLYAIRDQWSTDIYVGGIPAVYIRDCISSCEGCKKHNIWDETHNVSLEFLDESLDSLCKEHRVLRRRYKRRMYKNHIVTLYRCHRSGNKERAHRKTTDITTIKEKDGRRERTSRLCNCEFQLKVVEPKLVGSTTEADKVKLQATIYIHTKHSRHNPGSDQDSFFLPVHPFVVSWAIENLKYMHSARAVATASERAQTLFMESVGELERVTYRFHIIQKEVQALAYSMRVNGTYNYISINMDV